jgi:plasmid stabilization system protein ParE
MWQARRPMLGWLNWRAAMTLSPRESQLMPLLIWSESALANVQRAYRFLAEKNLAAARRAVKAIREGVKILAVHPHVGRVIENMDEEFRDWAVDFNDSGYVVRYRFDNERVTIPAVRHQKELGF